MGLINRMAESIRLGIKNFLQITPASDKTITVTETSNHLTECFINRIWYWGNSRQLAELYKQIDTNKTMFWAAKSTKGLEIRKIHTGLPALICETLVNIVIADYNGTDVTSKNSTAYAERWEDIEKQNKLSDTVKQMLRDLCVVGDGAFKVSFDTAVSDVPIVEWYPAENIDFTYVRGRIREVKFYTDYTQKHRRYRFEETYGYGYIHYALYDDNGKEIDLHTVDALSWIDSKGVTFDESYMWAVPVLYGKSCHKGRGAGIIGIKTDAFDSLDEVWSQWMDALRACRTKQYVPNCLVPRNPETCQPISPNPFDNRFITVGNDMSENGNGNRIYTESPQIQHESYLSSYITALDLCLQGIISPSTLGIDTKKLDNADAQREKEKTTLYTRQNLVKITQNALQSLVAVVLNADGELNGKGIVEGLEVSVNFGEYANPSFESQVETVSKARQGGCPDCAKYIGKVFIDDVYSNGKKSDGNYPLLSTAIKNGLFHPRCKDSTSTYYPELDDLDAPLSEDEIKELDRQRGIEEKQQYAQRQAERFDRRAEYSLDEDNKRIVQTRADEWHDRANTLEEKAKRFSLKTDEQKYYRPVFKEDISKTFERKIEGETITIDTRKANTLCDNVYISDKVKLKRKELHDFDMQVRKAFDMLGEVETSGKPDICIISPEEMRVNAIASYMPMQNVLNVNSAYFSTSDLSDLQENLACPQDGLSTILHELIHWQDAKNYRAKFGGINDYFEYCDYLNKIYAPKVEKLINNGYNIEDISEYAFECLKDKAMDEVYNEYRVSKLLG